MPVITPSGANVSKFGDKASIVTWAAILSGDTATAVEMPSNADRSVQMTGTWGGATVKLQGSNDGVTYTDLTDPQANAISMTANALEAITELTRYIKPVISGGDGTTTVTVRVLMKRSR